MKKIVTRLNPVLLNLAIFALYAPRPVLATVFTVPNPVIFDSLEDVINFVLTNTLRQALVLALVGLFIYGGWVRMTARDDEKKLVSSVKIMTAAAGGFVIIALAPAIVDFIGSLIGVQGNLVDF